VAYGTIIRLFSMAMTALVLYSYTNIPGVAVGAAALSMGVTLEAIASKIMAIKILKRVNSLEGGELSYRQIYKFYYPLALTTTIALGVHPVVTFFVGRAKFPIESLAVLPVINSLVFIFRALGLSYQEVGISLLGDNREGFKHLKKFATILAVSVFSMLAVIAFTPLSMFWFETVSGLSKELSEFAILPLQLFVIMAPMTVLISWQRAVLVKSQFTKPITWATIIEVVGIIVTMYIAISIFDFVGAIAAVVALVLGRIGANTYLHFHYKNTE
jgi:hypothetical protein